MNAVSGQISTTETNISSLSTEVANLEADIPNLENQVVTLLLKTLSQVLVLIQVGKQLA